MIIAPMSFAKGLEFRAVVVMACGKGILPLDERVADAADEAELDDIYETERRLLYVACTHAREHLLVVGVTPTAEYLTDFMRFPGRSLSTKRWRQWRRRNLELGLWRKLIQRVNLA